MPTVVSSHVHSVDWHPVTHRLSVVFLNGSRYEYDDVDEQSYRDILGSNSVGKALRTLSAGHPYRKVG